MLKFVLSVQFLIKKKKLLDFIVYVYCSSVDSKFDNTVSRHENWCAILRLEGAQRRVKKLIKWEKITVIERDWGN